MAYNAQKISPIDFKPSVGVGINLPLNGKACFNTTFTTKEAVKNNLINWFLTNRGERPLNPTFGGNLRQYIFTQITDDNLDFLQEDLQAQVNDYFPNINIDRLEVTSQPDLNIINVLLEYNIQNTNINDSLNIIFD